MRGRIVALLSAAAVALAACQHPRMPAGGERPAAPSAAVPAAAACRVGPGGAPPVLPVRDTERGIGGTGAPALAERGIGGTGLDGGDADAADTGVVGVVTGFASLCVDGLEVALPAGTPVRIDGASASVADLRAGQVALVGSVGEDDALTARAVSVRHEVTGPVSRVLADGRTLLVAGQTVSLTDATWRATPVRPGEWVAVSGLRTPAGDIAASRIDRAPPGRVRVHGRLLRAADGSRMGDLPVRLPPRAAATLSPGAAGSAYVTVAGTLRDGVLLADSVTPDRLATDPAAAFGGRVRRLVIQGYVGGAGDRLRIGPAFEARAEAGLSAAPVPDLGIVDLVRDATDGSFVARSLRDAPLPAALPFGGVPESGLSGEAGAVAASGARGLPAPRAGAEPFMPAPVPEALSGSPPGRPMPTGFLGAPVSGGPGGGASGQGVSTTQPGMGGNLIPGLPPGTGGTMPPGFAGGFPGGPAGTVPGGVMGHAMR